MELGPLRSVRWTARVCGFLLGFLACLCSVYCSASLFLTRADSALFNLSLLTSDVYAVGFAYFVFRYTVHWLYYPAFALSVLGLYLYHSGDGGRGTGDGACDCMFVPF